MIDPNTGAEAIDDPIAGAGIPNAGESATTPSPEAESGAAGDPPDQQGQVPYAAMKEERTARQVAQQENALLKAQLAQIKLQAGGAVQYDQFGNPVNTQQQSQPQAQQMQKKLDELWETDPRKAMQTENMMMMNWYDNINTQVDLQEEAVSKESPDFNNYRAEVRKYIRQLPLQDRSKPGIVKLAYFAVRGQNVDTIVAQREQAILNRIKAGQAATGLGASGTVPASTLPSNIKLSEDQVKAANAMGVSLEDYVKNIKEAKKS